MSEQRLIDANALKKTMKNEFDCASATAYIRKLNALEKTDIIKTVFTAIDNAPTVAVDNYAMGYQDGVRKVLSEKPKGEWVDTDNYPVRWKCSNCGRRDMHIFDFCPNCGADMRGDIHDDK